MRVVFHPDNQLRYWQDYQGYTGIPGNVEFKVDKEEGYVILRGEGYGCHTTYNSYGNGAIHVRDDQFQKEWFIEVPKEE